MEKIKTSHEQHYPSEHGERLHSPQESREHKENLGVRDDRPERIKEARQEIAQTAKHAAEIEPQPDSAAAPSGHFYGSQKKQNYQKTMRYVRTHLGKREQLFSRVVHLKSVETLTDLAAKTLFRPTPLLFGGAISVFVTGVIYLLAKTKGYGIPGSGWLLVSFGFGYLLGLMIDMLRLIIIRRKLKN